MDKMWSPDEESPPKLLLVVLICDPEIMSPRHSNGSQLGSDLKAEVETLIYLYVCRMSAGV